MATECEQQDCFKEEFKRYKRRSAVCTDVIDFRYPELFTGEVTPVCTSCEVGGDKDVRAAAAGLSPPHLWKMYTLTSVPGLIVIPDPFLPGRQHRWVWQCLVNYPCRPNVCNLDAHVERSGEGRIWPAACGLKKQKLSKYDLLYKLRWVTLGYHYDWNTKEYYSHSKSPFPEDLAELSTFILEVAGFSQFVPEAAIVNYYHLDSTLSGHTDHSEKDLSIPLLSISFGQSSIFLVGGKTRQVRPKAMMLHSGDIVIMSNESRLAFHGVPKVLAPSPQSVVPECLSLAALDQIAQQQKGPEHGDHTCCICGANPTTSQLPPGVGAIATDDYTRGQYLVTGLGNHAILSSETLHKQTDHVEYIGTDLCGSTADLCTNTGVGLDHVHHRTSSDIDDGLDHQGTNVCLSCQQLIAGWPLFEQYLSVSRINVNVRQVVSEKHKF